MTRSIRTEKQVYAALKKRFSEADWQRFETSLGSGVPDTNGCLDGFECWFECKIARVARDTITVNLRKNQRTWIKKRAAASGNVYLAVAVLDKVFVVYGRDLERISNKDNRRAWELLMHPLKTFNWPDGKWLYA